VETDFYITSGEDPRGFASPAVDRDAAVLKETRERFGFVFVSVVRMDDPAAKMTVWLEPRARSSQASCAEWA
jgi:hypothetical protein